MAMADNLKEIILKQKELITALESETKAISENDLSKENDTLKKEIEKLKAEFFESKEKLALLSDENAGLKNALYEQIYNEKIAILNATAKKIDIYFESTVDGELDRLSYLEKNIKYRIDEMTKALKKHRVDIRDEIYKQIGGLSTLLNEKITLAKEAAAKNEGAFSDHEKTEFESLKNEQITDLQIKRIAKKNNIESFVGLNLINKLGILLIIIGVIAASRFTYVQLPNTLKGIFMFVLGGGMLIAGEILSRKKANIFSLGITSGGVGVLYVALGISYFGLKILDMYPAILLCVLITAGAFVLSKRYNSQTVATFALIGGYLPLFSISGNLTLLYGAMIYFVVLNLLALLISFNKKWIVSSYVGFFLNVAGTIYITINFLHFIADKKIGFDHFVLITYILFAFLIYTLIPILSTYYKKLKFKNSDVILLGMNTFISAILMYFVFYRLKLTDYTGTLAIVFALIYLLLGRFIEKRFIDEKNTQALFYLTGFSFVVLIIPFQFGKVWWSLGWLCEGVALTTYGILNSEKNFKRGGFIIGALCLFSFLYYDLLIGGHLFAYKYLAITLGSVIILSAYIFKKALADTFANVFKYVTMINLWFYSLYIVHKLDVLLYNRKDLSMYNVDYLTMSLSIVLTFLIAYAVPRIKTLSDLGTKIISMILYGIGILWLFGLNASWSPIAYSTAKIPLSVSLIGAAVIIIIGILSVLAMRDLIKCLVMERKLGVEWYPLIVSSYFVLILTQNLITQYNLAFTNAAISIIYVLTALSWIIFGFVKRYAFIRRFGLGLSMMAVAKLFILDLSFLKQGYQIVSYFAFGITLIAISFVYQYFNKRLEIKGEVVSDEKVDL